MVPFKCDVHGWMNAYVGVLDHPYFAVSKEDGSFEIKGLPPGTYTIEAWHEKLGATTQSVTIGAKESKEVSVHVRRGEGSGGLNRAGSGGRGAGSLPRVLPFPPLPPFLALDSMLHRFSQFVVGCTVLLVLAGSLVTSTGSGLAVPDWPTTLRLEHVHVPAVEMGRRHLLRARPPAHREHGRVPHDHPGRLAVARRPAAPG